MRLEDIKVNLLLSRQKPIHTGWIVKFFNNITTLKDQECIESGWKVTGILDVPELGPEKMPSIDPFADLDPTLNPENEESDDCHLLAVSYITADEFEGFCGSEIQHSNNEDDSEWEEAGEGE